MNTYTIVDADGYVMERGASLFDAADAIMTSDGREWSVRKNDDGGFTVWSRQQVANRPWAALPFTSYAATEDEAVAEFSEMIVSAGRWAGHCEAIHDATYDRMIAEMEKGDE